MGAFGSVEFSAIALYYPGKDLLLRHLDLGWDRGSKFGNTFVRLIV